MARIVIFQIRKQRTIRVEQLAQGQSQNWDDSWELLNVNDISDVAEVCPIASRVSLTLSMCLKSTVINIESRAFCYILTNGFPTCAAT